MCEIKKAVNEIYRLNDALRIYISESEENVLQNVTEYTEQEINALCFENKTELDAYVDDYAKKPLDFCGNLCEINIVTLPEQYGLLVKMHHIIGDAWTLSLLGTQFNKLMNGENVEAYSYTNYVESENSYIQSRRYERDKAFFLEQFKKCEEVTYLSEKQTDSLNACRKTFVVDKNKANQINDYAHQHGTSAFMMFTAALSVYMNRVKMNTEKFYIGTAVLNRNTAKEKNTAGMFVNTAPMLIELDNSKSFAENLSAIEDTAFSIFRHQKYNYGDVLSAIRKEYNFTEKLYDVMISYQNATVVGADIETTWYHSGSQSESLQIHIDDRDNEGVFRIHYDYLTDKFTAEEIEKMHQHISNLLFDAISNDTKHIYELNILSSNEKQKLLYDFNDTSVEYPRDKCVHQLFEKQVEKIPDKIAIIACDKTLTYKELNELANRIAHSLIEKGVGVGDIVAFMLPRKSYLIATMLGILKAGAAYMPIDPDYPQDRIEYMLKDSNAKYCITEENIEKLLNQENSQNPNVQMSRKNLCYCIYTSGSTGLPKGVVIKHSNLVNFASSKTNDFFKCFLNCEYVLFLNSIVFDITMQETFLPLLNSKSIFLLSELEINNIGNKLNEIVYDNIALITTPTKLSMFMDDELFIDNLKKISLVMCGAEAFPPSLFIRIKEASKTIVFNGYGPTETTCGASYSIVKDDSEIHIGTPISNTQIYIVDKYMQPTPIGVTGELCIAGDGVGVGYLNRPELTAEKFIDNPFGEGKLYKTGDLAYWREDGNIVYVGRNDFQVKIRGLRIELGEIENAICSIDGISQAVVVVRKNNESRQLICAFYTGTERDAKEIRSLIGKKLPKYMLPHIFTHLDEMPLTSSGKISRKALPDVDLENISNDTEYVAPENSRQKELCRLIETVLGTTPVGITDDFFDIGGDSLKAIEFVSKAHNEGIYFNLQNVFDYPTVKALCECIENGDKQTVSFSDVDFSKVNAILAKNTVEQINKPAKVDVGNILLAGATGYLGIHILSDFLDNDNGTAYCLVRGKDKADSTKRLQELLNFYFGDKYADMNRIEVICADLQKDNFGLTNAEYADLLGKVDTVINCAASVKHYGSYKYFYETNVETVKHLIDFCKGSSAKLIHTSTLSISGNGFGDDFNGYVSENEVHFYENCLYIGQPLDNVYARSKFESEKAVLDAISDGLQANIMRMGNLTNRTDGKFQKNYESNAFLNRLRGVIDLGVFPDYLMDLYMEFTPIDDAARAVMTIARHFDKNFTVFHINSTKVVYFDKALEYFNKLGCRLEVVNGEKFTELLRHTANQSNISYIFETFINDMNEEDKLEYDSNIRIKNEFTVKYLRNLGFEWTDIHFEYIKNYINYFKSIGYLGE